jgi:hypothetical protein
MQTTRKANGQYWTVPIVGVLIGLVYLIGFSIGGRPGDGVVGLTIMVVFSALIVLAGTGARRYVGCSIAATSA